MYYEDYRADRIFQSTRLLMNKLESGESTDSSNTDTERERKSRYLYGQRYMNPQTYTQPNMIIIPIAYPIVFTQILRNNPTTEESTTEQPMTEESALEQYTTEEYTSEEYTTEESTTEESTTTEVPKTKTTCDLTSSTSPITAPKESSASEELYLQKLRGCPMFGDKCIATLFPKRKLRPTLPLGGYRRNVEKRATTTEWRQKFALVKISESMAEKLGLQYKD